MLIRCQHYGTDNGLGMDNATLARGFEQFFTTKDFGKGTSVTLLLPGMLGDDDALDLPEAADNLHRANEELVLLVEDDPHVRKIVRRQLTDLGYPVLEAENGHDAVCMLENVSGIAVVLPDIAMPLGINGWALARFVKINRPDIRVALMNGYAYGSSEEEIDDPELSMLNKPFEVSQLATVLRASTA